MQQSLLDPMEGLILSPAEFISMCNQTLDGAYPIVEIEGEVSGFTVSKGKFIFFDIKDSESSLNCFATVFQLRTPVEDGMKIRLIAQPKLTQWGRFSLTVRSVRPVGEGSLKRAFEMLKQKLEKEGLFDVSRKRILPQYPQRIAVVSSAQAAGFKDFITILQSRWGGLEIELIDVAVQGVDAPSQIVRAINKHNESSNPADVLVVTRGGGSLDDLSAFNDEAVVRAVASSRIPTVVAVGHEVDVSLADLAADVRASTPSNAAEIIVPNKLEFVAFQYQRLRSAKLVILDQLQRQRLVLQKSLETMVEGLRGPARQLEMLESKLLAYDPTAALARGYAIVAHNDTTVRSVSQLKSGDELVIQLSDGKVEATVHESR